MQTEEEELSALQTLIRSGEFRHSYEVGRKTEGKVFDRRTLLNLYTAIKNFGIESVDYPISSGKESIVFKATKKNEKVAIKIYRMSTLQFSNIEKYIAGDSRFERERRDRSRVVFLWARKEYANLIGMTNAGIFVPRPFYLQGNVLVMKYIGTESRPAPMIKNYDPDPEDSYRQVAEIMKRMYQRAGLIHGDLSDYNLLYYRKRVCVIDVGQSVSIKHPMAMEFLERDIKNITRFFIKEGVGANSESLLNQVTQDE